MTRREGDTGLPRPGWTMAPAADPPTDTQLPGFGVVGCDAHLAVDLERRATHVTPRAFATWCDGTLKVVVFGDDAFEELDPVEVKACLEAHGVVALLCPIGSGWAEFSRWAREDVGDVAAPAALTDALRVVLAAQYPDS